MRTPGLRELRLSLPLLFFCVTLTCSARLLSSTQCCPPNISSITIDHDELFELPSPPGRQTRSAESEILCPQVVKETLEPTIAQRSEVVWIRIQAFETVLDGEFE